jgi:hypothetical protein
MMTAFCLAGSAVREVSSLKYFMSPGSFQGSVPPASGRPFGGQRRDSLGERRRIAVERRRTFADPPLPRGSDDDLKATPRMLHRR